MLSSVYNIWKHVFCTQAKNASGSKFRTLVEQFVQNSRHVSTKHLGSVSIIDM